MTDNTFVLPDYHYSGYARMSSIQYSKLLDIISAYLVEYSVKHAPDDKRVVCNSREEYVELKMMRFNYLKESMDNNVEENVIESFVPKKGNPIQSTLDDLINVYGDYSKPKMDFKFEDLLSDPNNGELLTRKIKISSFVDWAIRKKIPLPKEFIDFNLPGDLADIVNNFYESKKQLTSAGLSDTDKVELQRIRKKLTELTNEKIKWDSSIEAAVKIGLLFYEKGIERQPTKDTFIKEFSEQLGQGLPDSTIEKIYKALPPKHKQAGGRPKKVAAVSDDIDTIIQAAIYAGINFESREVRDVGRFRTELKANGYLVPSDTILEKICTEIKK